MQSNNMRRKMEFVESMQCVHSLIQTHSALTRMHSLRNMQQGYLHSLNTFSSSAQVISILTQIQHQIIWFFNSTVGLKDNKGKYGLDVITFDQLSHPVIWFLMLLESTVDTCSFGARVTLQPLS